MDGIKRLPVPGRITALPESGLSRQPVIENRTSGHGRRAATTISDDIPQVQMILRYSIRQGTESR